MSWCILVGNTNRNEILELVLRYLLLQMSTYVRCYVFTVCNFLIAVPCGGSSLSAIFLSNSGSSSLTANP